MNAGESKEALRDRLRRRRSRISESDYSAYSSKIMATLRQQREYRSAHVIHCYVSMNDRREVDTHSLIKAMIGEGREVVVPVTHSEDRTLSHFALSSFDELAPSKWGVLEPGAKVDNKRTPPDLELVVVPMVGGDEQGHRIGYGGGFYDRFLNNVQCPAIGLCFEQNMVPSLPTGDHDVPLDKIITEQRVIKRENSGE